MEKEKKTRKKLALHWQILIGIGLGAILGILLPSYVHYIKWAGDIFLRALKMIIIPLIFSSIFLGVAGMKQSKDLGRIAGKTFGFYAATTLIACILGLVLVNVFKPGVDTNIVLQESVSGVSATEVSFVDQIVAIVPDNIFSEMAKGNILPIIFFAIILGFFTTRAKEKTQTIMIDIFEAVNEVIMKVTMFVIKFTPYGVFAIVANVLGDQAGDRQALIGVFQSLGFYVIVVWIGLIIHGGIILPSIVKFMGKENPWRHISKMSPAILTAFSTCSSGAAFPLAMRDIQEKCGVSNKIASFTLPLGNTINMNGTALYECVTAIFIAQVYGLDLTITQQLMIVMTSLLAAIGAAGIPMAGLVMLAVVLNAVGLPLEGIGLVLAVQQILDMPRTAINIYGDCCGAVVIAKSEGETLTI